jgi:SAM-dependent methyltransferase
MASRGELHVPKNLLAAGRDEGKAMESALWLLEHMREQLGLDDLGDTEVLDFGCGVRFSLALIDHGLPIKKYVGVDVSREVIDFLRGSVDDPRFEYFRINVHNEAYNPDGEILSEDLELPINGRTFDLVCLFSVFTHLAPDDFRTMLKLLRRFVTTDGRLFFTLYLDESTEHGRGLMDRWWANAISKLPREEVTRAMEKPRTTGARPTKAFIDLAPDTPLKWAVYSEPYARSLIEESGWKVLTLSPPDINTYIQHHFTCAPARQVSLDAEARR